jgi:hypothetical protein
MLFEPLPKNRVLRRLGNSQFDDGPGWDFDLLHRLTIVRNTAYTWMKRHAPDEKLIPFDEESHVLCGGSDSAEFLH